MSTINDIWGDRSQAPGPRGSNIGLDKTAAPVVPIYRSKPHAIDSRQREQSPEERANEIAKALEASDNQLKSEYGK